MCRLKPPHLAVAPQGASRMPIELSGLLCIEIKSA
jgi:hypothetical protein